GRGKRRPRRHGRSNGAVHAQPPAQSRHCRGCNKVARSADYPPFSKPERALARQNLTVEYSSIRTCCRPRQGLTRARNEPHLSPWSLPVRQPAGPRAPMNEPRLNLPELTVSELSTALKRTIEDAYGYVRVRGELGKVSYHGNGHVYFDLKDDRACIAGVIWRSTALRIQLRLEAGLEVVVTGRLTTYPGRSQYQ